MGPSILINAVMIQCQRLDTSLVGSVLLRSLPGKGDYGVSPKLDSGLELPLTYVSGSADFLGTHGLSLEPTSLLELLILLS